MDPLFFNQGRRKRGLSLYPSAPKCPHRLCALLRTADQVRTIFLHTPTLRRLLLSFLLRLIEHTPPVALTDRHLQLYDECLLRISKPDSTCIPALSMKIAATLTQAAPELCDELSATLELLDNDSLMPAQRAAKRIVLKRMRTRKTRKRQ